MATFPRKRGKDGAARGEGEGAAPSYSSPFT